MAEIRVVRAGSIAAEIAAAVAASTQALQQEIDAHEALAVDAHGGIVAGTDARLSNTRTPTDATVTNVKVSAAAAIAESKLALASDAAAGTASRRTLGAGALQAAAGNDSRLHNRQHSLLSGSDHSDAVGTPQGGNVLTWNGSTSRWEPAAAGGVPDASESQKGAVELATPAETQAGTDSVRAVHPAGLASALAVKLAPPAVIAPSLTSGWVNFGGGEAEAGYYKDALGVVHLAGVVKNGSTGAGTGIFTLPSGHRPALIERFSPYNAGSTPPTVKIFPDGRVEPTIASNTALSLSGITFRGI